MKKSVIKKCLFSISIAALFVSLNVYADTKDIANTKEIVNGKAFAKNLEEINANGDDDEFQRTIDSYLAASIKDKEIIKKNAISGVKEAINKMLPARLSAIITFIKFDVTKDKVFYTYKVDVDKKDLNKDVTNALKLELTPKVCSGQSKMLLNIDFNMNYAYVDKRLTKITDVLFTKQDCK